MPRASAQTTVAALLVGRSAIEAVLFAGLFAAAQVLAGGARSIPVAPTALALTGAGIILASILRDARADRQNTAIALTAMAAAAALGLFYAAPRPDGVMILTRIVMFGILGEAFVWRNLSLARALVRWTDARNAGFMAIGLVALVALMPGAIDRSGLVIVGLAAAAATGIALSLARSAEELSLAGRDARGHADRSTASGTAILLAILSVIAAIAAPFVGELVRPVADAALPLVGSLVYGVLLALGYVAELFVVIVRSVLQHASVPQILPPTQPLGREDEAEMLRQIEATRPYVIGAVEIIVAIVALLVVVLLVDRMARERRQTLPEGATLDRESTAGVGFGAFLGGLLPRRARRPGPPRDDGTPAGALRALYWRYLARGDAAGVPWRAVGETPAEHQRRAIAVAPRRETADVLVRAFEDLRYGERDPDPATVERARAALAAVEQPQ